MSGTRLSGELGTGHYLEACRAIKRQKVRATNETNEHEWERRFVSVPYWCPFVSLVASGLSGWDVAGTMEVGEHFFRESLHGLRAHHRAVVEAGEELDVAVLGFGQVVEVKAIDVGLEQ